MNFNSEYLGEFKSQSEWSEVKVLESSNENVLKYIFKKDDALVEAVLYKYPTYEERTVMCISVMCGCPMGCTFCGTGKFYSRNLTSSEIESQVYHMLKDRNINPYGIKNWQIMTMSMGEPMLTQGTLIPALDNLNKKFPKAKLLVSTAAPKVDYRPFMDFAERVDTVGLQFSVHESTDEARDRLVKAKGKLDLASIVEQGEVFFYRTGRHPFFNYCVHENNNSQDDVDRLLEHGFNPKVWQSTISVICEKDETVAQSISRQEQLCKEFELKMMKVGYSTRVFNPAGQDMSGGCGQLWEVQRWAKDNPDKVKRSVGGI